jgi:membrane-bound ClpP family serine protease
MSLIVTLILVALVLVAFEVILPGGVLGVISAVCLVAATILTHMDYGIWAAVGVFFGTGLLAIALVMVQFKLLRNTSLGSAFFLKESVTGHTGPTTEISLIGKEGTALTRLNPGGRVTIEGKTYDASSQDGYLDAKQAVVVVAQNNFKLTIRKL